MSGNCTELMDLEKKHGIVSIGLGLRSDKLKKKKKRVIRSSEFG